MIEVIKGFIFNQDKCFLKNQLLQHIKGKLGHLFQTNSTSCSLMARKVVNLPIQFSFLLSRTPFTPLALNSYSLDSQSHPYTPRDWIPNSCPLLLSQPASQRWTLYCILANRAPALPGKNLVRYTKFSLLWPVWVLEFGVPQGPGVRLAGSCLC